MYECYDLVYNGHFRRTGIIQASQIRECIEGVKDPEKHCL